MLNTKPLPSQQYLNECFEYCSSGALVWKARPLDHFQSLQSYEKFLVTFAGKIAGTVDDRYVKINLTYCGKKIKLYAHRIVWTMHNGDIPEGFEIDHDDTNQLNNRITNLRQTTSTGNNMNRSIASNNTSGVKGVSWDKIKKKWVASVTANYKRVKVGYFNSVEEAFTALQTVRLSLHKEFTNHGAL